LTLAVTLMSGLFVLRCSSPPLASPRKMPLVLLSRSTFRLFPPLVLLVRLIPPPSPSVFFFVALPDAFDFPLFMPFLGPTDLRAISDPLFAYALSPSFPPSFKTLSLTPFSFRVSFPVPLDFIVLSRLFSDFKGNALHILFSPPKFPLPAVCRRVAPS